MDSNNPPIGLIVIGVFTVASNVIFSILGW